MSVVDDLRAEDLGRRRVAIEALGLAGAADAEALEALAACLGDRRKAVQRPAADAFAALHRRGVDVRSVLDAALVSADPRRRWGAAYAFSRLGASPPGLVPVLLEALATDDGDTRWAAAGILVALGLPELPGQLLALSGSESAAQRKMALYCLRDLGAASPEAEVALHAALADPDPGVRLAGMAALARLAADREAAAGRVAALLADADAGVRRAAAATLGRLGVASPAVLTALRRARAGDDPSLARAAGGALDALGAGAA